MSKRVAIYAGSFDPLTNGHLDVLKGAMAVADEIIVAIGIQHGKTPVFTFEQRVALIEEVAASELHALDGRVRIISFSGLLIDAARANGATIMIRGLRRRHRPRLRDADGRHECRDDGAGTADGVHPGQPRRSRTITATLVRQIAAMGGDVRPFVPGRRRSGCIENQVQAPEQKTRNEKTQ
jgi:pantetheine-phosphate adenylyltransferase